MNKTIGPTLTAILPLSLLVISSVLHAQDAPVKVTQQRSSYILQNAYVTAEVDRTTGDLKSLKYSGHETMGYVSGHHAGYWEQNPSAAAELTDGLSIDPASNSGERAEVYIRGKADGKSMQRGGNSNGMVVDLEIRYALGRSDHGIYTYAIFSHPASYPRSGVGESRFGAKLNGQLFDWISIDPRHNQLMPTGYDWDHGQEMNMKEARRLTTGKFAGKVEHKYDYSTDLFDAPAFGWSSTKDHVGLFFINPSQEFLSGGPTKYELTGHLDDGAGGDPTLLDYWRSTHYGGSTLDLPAGEEWTKVVGPIFVYTNSGPTPQAIYADALREAKRQQQQWPFNWVNLPEYPLAYPLAAQRATISGKLNIADPLEPTLKPGRILVGLIPPGESDGSWQTDARHYQFWVDAHTDGAFSIPNVRPGTYLLTALADGVLGQFNGPSVTVAPGKPLDFGSLPWTPQRFGPQLWEIGIPNRNGSEFFMGDQYDRWGNYLLYSKLFPNDVHFTIGKSDYRKDWFYEQVPNVSQSSGAKPVEGAMQGGDTTWTIDFDLTAPPSGSAVLRAAICGVSARHIYVTVNGQPAGDLAPLTYNATINRDGIQGTWTEHDVRFPASLLKPGKNQVGLRIPGGNVTSGVIYDYLRLEAEQPSKPQSAPATN